MKKFSKFAALALAVLLLGAYSAQAADGKKVFRIVLVPERNIFEQQRKYRMLCEYTCQLLPLDFSFEVLKSYKEVLSALKEGKADAAFMGSYIATYGIDNYGFIPLLRPVWASGASHYSSCIFKRADLSVTRDVESWRGKSFVFVGPHTSAGYFYPLYLLRKNGVKEPGEFFSRSQFAESHDAAIWMVANNMADLGAAKSTIFEETVKRKPDLGKKTEILYIEGKFPDSTLVVRGDLSLEIRESIRNVFLRMDSNPEGRVVLKMFGARRFIETTPNDFDEVRQVVDGSGFEIRNMGALGY